MKELSKDRLLYWVETKINIINIKESVIPTDEETQAYRQICQIIELHFVGKEKIKKIKSVGHDIFKIVSLGILYEKLIVTPAKEIKKLAMEEIKKELEELEREKGGEMK